MAIFGISDLHLALSAPFCHDKAPQIYKPMDILGGHWHDHPAVLYERWCSEIGAEDTVLLPGDLSWAMNYEAAKYDFDFLSKLPGKLIVSKGNHDYWWDTKAKAERALPGNTKVLQHESCLVEDVLLAAIRGWVCPGSRDFSAEDAKIYRRELIRLELALKDGERLLKQAAGEVKQRWLMLHFRPVNDNHQKNEIIELLQAYHIDHCFYGHLHGEAFNKALIGEHWGIDFGLLSCDYLNFSPLRLR